MDKDKKSDYWELLDKLVDCEQGSEREFAIYKELVEISDAEIKATEEEAKADVFDPQTGKLLSEQPIFLDDFAAPMDNLARIYIDREEFDKALPLLSCGSMFGKSSFDVSGTVVDKVTGAADGE